MIRGDRTGGIGKISSGSTTSHLIAISFTEAIRVNPSLKFTHKLHNNSLVITFNQILGVIELKTVENELKDNLSDLITDTKIIVTNNIGDGDSLNYTIVTAIFK